MKIIKITNIDTHESFKNFNKELEELCSKYNYKLINDNLLDNEGECETSLKIKKLLQSFK